MAIRAEGYSIWMEPEGETKGIVDKVIANLASNYNTPVFPGHVPLLGNITGNEQALITKLQKLGELIVPFYVRLNGQLIMERSWYRALAIRANQSYPLQDANRKARETFNMKTPIMDDLHMSFMYSEEVSERDRNQIYLDLPDHIKHLEFPTTKLHLWRTDGQPHRWHKVEEVMLTAKIAYSTKQNTK